MALQSSGAISIGNLRTEFQTSAGALSQFYRGGGIVPNVSQNYGVPGSGAISLGGFYGATRYINVSATISATDLSTGGSNGTLTTGSVTATGAGGNAGYSYSWRRIGGDTSTTCNSPSSATTTFTATVTSFQDKNSSWVCDVSDGTTTGTTPTVTVDISGRQF